MSQQYAPLLSAARVVAKKYGYDELMEGYDVSLVNILMCNHIQKVRDATSYEKALQLIEQTVAMLLGAKISVSEFISDENDRIELYRIFAQWRSILLGEVQPQQQQQIQQAAYESSSAAPRSHGFVAPAGSPDPAPQNVAPPPPVYPVAQSAVPPTPVGHMGSSVQQLAQPVYGNPQQIQQQPMYQYQQQPMYQYQQHPMYQQQQPMYPQAWDRQC